MLLAAPHFERVARSAAPRLIERLADGLGPDTSLLRELALYLPWGPQGPPAVDGREVLRLRVLDQDRELLVERLLRWTEGWLGRHSDSAFARWLARSVPIGPGGPETEEIFAELSTAPSHLAGACLGGDLDACRVGLVLEPVRDSITEWYDLEGRRNLVRRLTGLQRQDRTAALVCIERAWYQVCEDLLRRFAAGSVPPPISYAAREHLVRFALTQGGSGAHGRLYADWQMLIASARPRPVTLRAGVAAWTLAWIAAFLGLALASTRWR
jgi:hypothetical protein